MATRTIDLVRNDDDATVAFHCRPVPGYRPGQLDRELDLSTEVPFAEIPAEVARLRAAGHEVAIGKPLARRLAAMGIEVSR